MKRRQERAPEIICLVLAVLLMATAGLEARLGVAGAIPARQTGSEQKPNLKELILEVPTGTMIEVRLLNKQKMRGRLGEVTDEGFSLTTARGGKIATEKVVFTEVKSIKKVEGGTAGRALLYGLAGIGALFVAIVVWGLAVASSSD